MKNQVHYTNAAKTLSFLLLMFFLTLNVSAQSPATIASGATYTIDGSATPTTFVDFAGAINALNATAANSITSTVTFNVPGGQSFTHTPLDIIYTNSTGSPTCRIIFQKSGAGVNPVIKGNSGVGAAAPGDAVLRLTGGNYYTFDGIDLTDDSTATTTDAERMEIGFYLNGLTPSGCSNNIFRNGNITLISNQNALATYGIYSNTTSNTTNNKYNAFSTNNIKQVKFGIYMNNTSNQAAFLDVYNQLNGNVITKIRAHSTAIAGIYTVGQQNISIFSNHVHSINISPVSQAFAGIQFAGTTTAGINASANIYNNTVGNTTAATGINITGGSASHFGVLVGTTFLTTSNAYANVYNNNVNNFSSTSSQLLYSISVYTATVCNIYQNTIQNITASINYCIYTNLAIHNIYENTLNTITGTSTTQAYGIYAVSGGIIYNNTLTNFKFAGTLMGIYCATGISSIYGNTIIGMQQTGTAASNPLMGIWCQGLGANSTIYNNTISSLHNSTAVAAALPLANVAGIYINAGTTPRVYNNTISSNKQGTISASTTGTSVTGVGTKFLREMAVGNTIYVNGVLIGTVAAAGITNDVTLTLTANATQNLSAVNFAVPIVSIGIGISVNNSTPTISGNTIDGMTTAGESYGIYTQNGSNAPVINSNTVQNIFSTAGTPVAGISINGSIANASCFGNTVSKVASAAVAAVINGINIVSPSGAINVFNNNISDIYNSRIPATGIGSSVVTGLNYTCASGIINNFYGNTISNISTAGTIGATVQTSGMIIAGSNATNNVYRNKIFNVSSATTSTGSAVGLHISATGTNNIYNNMIYDIDANNGTASTLGGSSKGIYATGGTSRYDYNTVFLDGASTGSVNQQSSAIYLISTTQYVRNNLFVNASAVTSGASSYAYAMWFSATTTPSVISNNLLYAGATSGTHNYLSYNGTTRYQDLTAYKGSTNVVAKGDATLSQTLTGTLASLFASPTGTIDVHLNGNPTDVYQKGTPVTTPYVAPLDFDGDIRSATTPTIGADESCVTPANPGAFSAAPSPVCQGAVSQVYTVPPVTNATFLWTVPAGVVIAAGQFTNSITVNYRPDCVTPANISVVITNGCGVSSTPQSVSVTVNPLVRAAGVITGTALTCQGSTASYTTPAIPGASTYLWTVPGTLGTINGSATGNSINVDISSSAVSGNITVQGVATGGCGNGPAYSFPVTSVTTPAAAGTITSSNGGDDVCVNETGLNYSVSAISGATSYIWVLPSGGTIVSGNGTNNITVNYSSATSGNVTVSGSNGLCSGASSSFPVTVNPLPAAPAATAGSGATSSQFAANWNTVSGAISYLLDVSTNNFATFVTANSITYNGHDVGNILTYTVTGLNGGTNYSYRVRANNDCGESGNSNTISISTLSAGGCPMVGGTSLPAYSIICSTSNQTLTSNGSGGTYQWQNSMDNNTWNTLSGETNSSYTTPNGNALGANKVYYRRLVKNASCFDVSSTIAVVEISNSPAVTPITVTGRTSGSLTLDWSPVGLGNYDITYTGTGIATSTISAATPPKTLSGLSANGTYNVTITQTGAPLSGCPASGTLSGEKTLCAIPTGVTTTTQSTSSIKVDWTGPAGNYRVYYRSLFTQTTYSFKDVTTISTSGTYTLNNLGAGGGNFEIYVVAKDCPTTGLFGQPSELVYGYTNSAGSPCNPTWGVDYVRSLCPVQIEVAMHGSPTGKYAIYLQRLTPAIGSVVGYTVTGDYFQTNIGAPGETYLVAVLAKCASGNSNMIVDTLVTKPLCSAVSNLVLSNPTCKGFTASWNSDVCSAGTQNYYGIYIRKLGALSWNSYPVYPPAAPTNPYKLVNWLTKSTTVQVYVRTVYQCSGYTSLGLPSNVETITTLTTGCREEETFAAQDELSDIISSGNSEILTLYPNPNSGQFQINLSQISNGEEEVRTEVMNLIGQTVLTNISSISNGNFSEIINLPATITSGTYFVRLTAGENVYNTKMNISR